MASVRNERRRRLIDTPDEVFESGYTAGLQDEVVKALFNELDQRNDNSPTASSTRVLKAYNRAIEELK